MEPKKVGVNTYVYSYENVNKNSLDQINAHYIKTHCAFEDRVK